MNMVEKVARAIEEEGKRTQQTVIVDPSGIARAAIEAMYDPTDDLKEIIADSVRYRVTHLWFWRAMIRTILGPRNDP